MTESEKLEWLKQLEAGKRGPLHIRPAFTAYDYLENIAIEGDASGWTFDFDVRSSLVSDPTDTSPDAEFTVTVGSYDAGNDETIIALALTKETLQTLNNGTDLSKSFYVDSSVDLGDGPEPFYGSLLTVVLSGVDNA